MERLDQKFRPDLNSRRRSNVFCRNKNKANTLNNPILTNKLGSLIAEIDLLLSTSYDYLQSGIYNTFQIKFFDKFNLTLQSIIQFILSNE